MKHADNKIPSDTKSVDNTGYSTLMSFPSTIDHVSSSRPREAASVRVFRNGSISGVFCTLHVRLFDADSSSRCWNSFSSLASTMALPTLTLSASPACSVHLA
ncbi:hypothetical protein KC19_4G023300 [Ceratodon purpureus]|uniref:Uncharacterized protein n=1 Tax=Ceratodon purpureus TaxID=3225 RepID=A0A8T0I5S7_CERPU|nr:hypothetical protein KC19_4G023300 [Ceratodon purpureus]